MGDVGGRLTAYEHDGLRFDVRDRGPEDGPGRPGAARLPADLGLVGTGRRPARRGRLPGPRARPAGLLTGCAPARVSAYALPALVGDVLALADAAGVERFDLLGHDWGGAVAWAAAAAHPDRVRTLTVASTPHPAAMIAAMPHGQALRCWYMAAFQLPGLPERVLGGRRSGRRVLASMGTPHPEQVQALLADRDAARGALAWYRAAFRGVAGRGREPVRRVRVPTTYVWSDARPGAGAVGRRAHGGVGGRRLPLRRARGRLALDPRRAARGARAPGARAARG